MTNLDLIKEKKYKCNIKLMEQSSVLEDSLHLIRVVPSNVRSKNPIFITLFFLVLSISEVIDIMTSVGKVETD